MKIPRHLKFGKLRIHLSSFFLVILGIFQHFTIELVILYAVAIMHEFAHILAINRLGAGVNYVEILPFGVTADVNDIHKSPLKHKFIIFISGPLFNFLFAYIIYCVYRGSYRDYLVTSSLVMGIFNLLPAMPLDGGRILQSLFVHRFGRIKGTKITLIFTVLTSVILGVLGTYFLYIARFNFSMILISAFLIANITAEQKRSDLIFLKDILYSKQKLEKGKAKGQLIIANAKSNPKTIANMINSEKYSIINVVDNNGKLVGTLTETQLLEGLLRDGKIID